jgi:hypothetical protein
MSNASPTHHAVVWIDHKKASVIRFDRNSDERVLVRHRDAAHTIHHKSGTMGSGHVAEDSGYLAAVADALQPAREILIVGPGSVKSQLKAYLDKHDHALAKRVVGVEGADHPTDAQLLALARTYFIGANRMQGSAGTA